MYNTNVKLVELIIDIVFVCSHTHVGWAIEDSKVFSSKVKLTGGRASLFIQRVVEYGVRVHVC